MVEDDNLIVIESRRDNRLSIKRAKHRVRERKKENDKTDERRRRKTCQKYLRYFFVFFVFGLR